MLSSPTLRPHGPVSPPILPTSRGRGCLGIAALSWLLFAISPLPLLASSQAQEAKADYEQWIDSWPVAEQAVAVPEDGISWGHDTARWHLASGTLRPLAPSNGGGATGFYFEGEGRFRMGVPDPIEAAHLERIAEQPGLEALDLRFDRLLLRTSDGLVDEVLELSQDLNYNGSDPQVRELHERCLIRLGTNVDAKVLAGRLLPKDRYLRVEMRTKDLGWMSYEHDDQRREEIQLVRLELNYFPSIWISLDRPEDRNEDGSATSGRRALFDLQHVDLEIDLTGKAKPIRVGRSNAQRREARVEAQLHLVALNDGGMALPLALGAFGKVHTVHDEHGSELSFVRDHLGGRSANYDEEIYSNSLLVLLERPLARGETRRITVTYDYQAANYFLGRQWYPGLPDNLNDQHTATLTVHTKKRHEVRAIGELEEETANGKLTTSRWQMREPTKMVSLTYGSSYREERIEVEGIPEVLSFGPQVSKSFGGNMIRNVGADVANSLQFFQWLLDDKLPTQQLQVTGIAAGHGQAFEGFLHMADSTYASESPGASELFRAHETAHQWWGHRIGWQSYRDQWLSESFAEYTALMYVQSVVKGGEKHFEEALEMYTQLLMGSVKGLFSKFARPFLTQVDLSQRKRMGPIGLGYRASTAQIPSGYVIQAYHKGPLVLHMLRQILAAASGGSDDLFVAILRDFVKHNKGRDASTQDFLDSLNRVAPGDWTWFVDQWIHGTTIPTYRWDYRLPKAADENGQWQVEIEIEQQAPEGFRMLLPLAIELKDGRKATSLVEVNGPQTQLTLPVPVRPKRLQLAPGHSVLAKIKRR